VECFPAEPGWLFPPSVFFLHLTGREPMGVSGTGFYGLAVPADTESTVSKLDHRWTAKSADLTD